MWPKLSRFCYSGATVKVLFNLNNTTYLGFILKCTVLAYLVGLTRRL